MLRNAVFPSAGLPLDSYIHGLMDDSIELENIVYVVRDFLVEQRFGLYPRVFERPAFLPMHLNVLEHVQSRLLNESLGGTRVVTDIQGNKTRGFFELLADHGGEAAIAQLIMRQVNHLHILVERKEIFDSLAEFVPKFVLPEDQALEPRLVKFLNE